MKFALLFFCCFVSISHQEVERYIAPRNHPRSLYVPLFYADGLPAGYDIIQNNDHQSNEGRANTANRFLTSILPMATVTRTSTVLTTTTQIVSSATQVKCIPANQFVGGTAPAACARRRRDIESPGLLDIIQPDVPLELETSALAMEAPIEQPQPVAEILSSKSDEEIPVKQPQFSARYLSTVVTNVTVTSTVYSFVPVTVSNTKTIATANGLSCLPAGYLVC